MERLRFFGISNTYLQPGLAGFFYGSDPARKRVRSIFTLPAPGRADLHARCGSSHWH